MPCRVFARAALIRVPLQLLAAERMNDSDHHAYVSFDDHLHLPGLAEQFASQTDAYLHVDGDYVPVHTAVLALQSPVFADMFKLASDNSTAVHRQNGNICIPMTSHTFAGVCAAIKFLYQWTTSNWENTPSKGIWRDIDTARPILQFAHKFNMKNILKDCDICLSEKAQEDQGRKLFCHTDAVVMWAALAEEFTLTHLLSHAELFMAKTLTPNSWLRDHPVTSQLSQACLFRVLRAAQQYTIDSMQAYKVQENKRELGYSPLHARVVPAKYAPAEDLRQWRLHDLRDGTK